MEDLAKYGPAKRPDKQCIDTYQTDDYGNLIDDKVSKGPYYCMDPTGAHLSTAVSCMYLKILWQEGEPVKLQSRSLPKSSTSRHFAFSF
jgi:hypothetical protein